jgi:LAS superfamily LD-carboxypeptidase LdcB
MSELIKSVRIRPIEGSTDDLKIGRLDTKVSLFRDNRRTRNCIGYSISSTGDELGVNWSSIEYQGRRYNDLSDDDIIKDYIRTNTLKERPREGEFVNLEGNQVPFYKIVQDPFEKTPPSVRIYGSDPYYLNNGCKLFIRWYTSEKKTISWSYNNVSTPDQVTNGIVSIQITTNEPNRPPITFTYDSTNNPLQVGATPSYIDIEIYWEYQSGQLFSLTSNELVYQPPGKTFIDDSKLVSSGGEKYGSKSNESYAIDGFIDDARDSITQSISIKPEGLVKTVEIIPPGEDEVWVISNKSDDHISNFVPVYKKDLNESIEIKYFSDNSYSDDFSRGQDWKILSSLLSAWNKSVPNYNVQLCQPSFIENIEIEYKDPLKPADELVTEPEPEVVDNSKIKLNISFSDNFQVKVREDSPEFTINIGEPSIEEDGFLFSDDQDDLLDDEFRESAFASEEEQIEFNLNSDFGESDGAELDDSSGSFTSGNKTATDNASKSGGDGIRRFQQKLTVQGRTVLNGELPEELLSKCFSKHKIEKNAARQLDKLNEEFKKKFGQDMKITDGYRIFNVQNKIFDWNYFDTGLNPFTNNQDKKQQGRKIGSFKKSKPTGVSAAKPGTSKHGWGQAIDIDGFGNGPGNKYFDWMEQNAKKFGWINPDWAKKPGASYEPWHWEYNGNDLFKT